jgi:drug/metabolite transporter (DMT)-like permease
MSSFTIQNFYLLLPLSSAVGYAVAALMLKRGMAFGVGPWRITFFSNWAMALAALPLVVLRAEPAADFAWHLPFLPALTFFLGQIFTFLALFRGDVSVATPLMGTKVLFVAFLTVVLLGQPIPVSWWIAAFLATAALGLLGGGKSALQGKLWPTVPYALLSAFLFASTDLMVQEWAPRWGVTRFLPAMVGLVALYSFVFLPFFRNPLFSVAAGGWRWVGGGCLLLGVQALVMGYALGAFGNATAVNIAYSSRGIWSVLLIWVAGQWFMNDERALGRAIMTRRLIGAGMLLAAVVLVIIT